MDSRGHQCPPSVSHPSGPVSSTGKFWGSIFKLHPDCDHLSPPWSNPLTLTWGPEDSSGPPLHSLPTPASPSSRSQTRSVLCSKPHVAPSSPKKKAKVLPTYKAPPKLTAPTSPTLSPAQPSPCFIQAAPTILAPCPFLDTPSRFPPQDFCMCFSFCLEHASF